MHGARRRALLLAVEALIAGRRLTLIDLARSWPGAERVRGPLKRLDRLLSNCHLAGVGMSVGRAMARLLLNPDCPVILVDWADLKADGRWCVLRAAIPVGGRALTLYEQVFPISMQNRPAAQKAFLRRLRAIVPETMRPILVTDAGFRSDWYRAVSAVGWFYVGRVRGNVRVRMADGTWQRCQVCYDQARHDAQDLGLHALVRGRPWDCHLLLQRRPRRGRQRLTRRGQPSRDRRHRKAAQAAREPWLLAVCPHLAARLAPDQIMAIYAKRMQIEEAFRDLKSHRYGVAFEDSLTRKPHRLTVLLLLQTLATFAAWIAGQIAERTRASLRVLAAPSARRRYSLVRIGRELLARRWLSHALDPPPLPASIPSATHAA